jgi:iron-sulfur cluster repair protein YtfE (RIC family)
MQAIQLLKQQHGEAKAAFQEIETAPASGRRALWGKLRRELEMHEQMEEKYLYGPVAREAQGDSTLASWESTHMHEVQEAEMLIKEIDRQDPSGDAWLATVKKLRGALEQHIRKEEQEIWPRIERVWNPARLEEAGRQMEAMKQGQTAKAH